MNSQNGKSPLPGGQAHEVHVALAEAPEIRPKLHPKVGQPTGHRRPGNQQGGNYDGPVDPRNCRL